MLSLLFVVNAIYFAAKRKYYNEQHLYNAQFSRYMKTEQYL